MLCYRTVWRSLFPYLIYRKIKNASCTANLLINNNAQGFALPPPSSQMRVASWEKLFRVFILLFALWISIAFHKFFRYNYVWYKIIQAYYNKCIWLEVTENIYIAFGKRRLSPCGLFDWNTRRSSEKTMRRQPSQKSIFFNIYFFILCSQLTPRVLACYLTVKWKVKVFLRK